MAQLIPCQFLTSPLPSISTPKKNLFSYFLMPRALISLPATTLRNNSLAVWKRTSCGLKRENYSVHPSPKALSKILNLSFIKGLILLPIIIQDLLNTLSPSKQAQKLRANSESTQLEVLQHSELLSKPNFILRYFVQLKNEIGDFLKSEALLFSSGWLACFGFIKAIIKDYDCALLDEQADPALFEGANYTTKKVYTYKHLDHEDMRNKLKELRKT